MWGKIFGRIIDGCVATGVISLTALVVTKAVSAIRAEVRSNGSRNPE